MKNLVYNERQSYGNESYVLIALPMVIAFVLGCISFFDLGLSPTEFYMVMAVNTFISIGLLILFRNMVMDLRIMKDHIVMQYRPFARTPLMVHKSDIVSWELREIRPIAEYGGWGYKKRKNLHKPDNISYTIKGKSGLQLMLKDGSSVLIGTQRRQALEYAMHKWMEEEYG